MGSAASRVVLPPLEVRVNKCMKFYLIKEAEVKRFYYIFTRLDKNLSGVIDIADFFKFLHEPRSIVGDTIFELVDCRSTIAITFTEFFYAVLTYCFFEVCVVEDYIGRFASEFLSYTFNGSCSISCYLNSGSC